MKAAENGPPGIPGAWLLGHMFLFRCNVLETSINDRERKKDGGMSPWGYMSVILFGMVDGEGMG